MSKKSKTSKRGRQAPHMVTAKRLAYLRACPDGIEAFKKHFPSGRASWPRVMETYLGLKNGCADLWWYIARSGRESVPLISWRDRLRVGFTAISTTARPQWLLADIAASTPASVTEATWDARVGLVRTAQLLEQADGADRASVELARVFACRCPSDVPGSTFTARLAEVDPSVRLTTAWFCAADVEGATWEARSALARTAKERRVLALWCDAGVGTFSERMTLLKTQKARAAIAVHIASEVVGATWEARLAECKTTQQRNYLAIYAPTGTHGASWEKRVALVSPNARLALALSGVCYKYYASPDKPQPLWAERLAILRTREDRAAFACRYAGTPWIVPNIELLGTWEERAALVETDEERKELALFEGLRVVGATYEARMALLPPRMRKWYANRIKRICARADDAAAAVARATAVERVVAVERAAAVARASNE